jgi:hypothetical protein
VGVERSFPSSSGPVSAASPSRADHRPGAGRRIVDLEAMVGLAQACRPPAEPAGEGADDSRLTELAARLTLLFK